MKIDFALEELNEKFSGLLKRLEKLERKALEHPEWEEFDEETEGGKG